MGEDTRISQFSLHRWLLWLDANERRRREGGEGEGESGELMSSISLWRYRDLREIGSSSLAQIFIADLPDISLWTFDISVEKKIPSEMKKSAFRIRPRR